MKVLLFTHSQDIDGIGCALLAKVAFKDLEIVPTKTFDINKNVESYINDGKINNFDQIYVTDLCIKEPLLKSIASSSLKDKVLVIDHHKSEIDEGNDKYDFVNITISKNDIKESGTSLFYTYLKENNYLKPTPILDELTELTRSYDVWDWKQNGQDKAREMHIIFEQTSYDEYLKIMMPKILNDNKIVWNQKEQEIITNYFKKFNEDIKNIISNIKVINLNINNENYKIGYVGSKYKYRNDINEVIKENNIHNIDAVGMIMSDIDTVSYRTIKDIDVSVIATYFGGKGHKAASSNPQNNEEFIKMCKENNITSWLSIKI